MRVFTAILGRELRERWALLPLSLGIGLLPLLPKLREIAPVSFPAIGLPLGAIVALMTGVSVIGRDLGDGRLAFYFARPVPAWVITAGKLAAALTLTLACTALASLPGSLASAGPKGVASELWSLAENGWLALLVAAGVALVACAHGAGVVYRSRSPWAALDFLLLGCTVVAAVWVLRLLWLSGAPLGTWQLATVHGFVATTLLAAAFVQGARGRTDVRRGHRALSTVVWGGLSAGLVLCAVLVARQLSFGPSDYDVRWLVGAAPSGRWVALAGVHSEPGRPGRWQTLASVFLLDTAGGGSRRVHVTSSSRIAFSADGRRAAWLRSPVLMTGLYSGEAAMASLDVPGAPVEDVRLETPVPLYGGVVARVALSARGDRLAACAGDSLLVFELPSGRLLARATGSGVAWSDVEFVEADRLRAVRRVQQPMPALELVEVRLPGPALQTLLRLDGWPLGTSNGSQDRLAVVDNVAALRRVRVVSVPDGRTLLELAAEGPRRVADGALLPDGRFAAVLQDEGAQTVVLYDREGTPAWSTGVPAADGIAGTDRGFLIVRRAHSDARRGPWRCGGSGSVLALSLADGRAGVAAERVWPSLRLGSFYPPEAPSGLGARLLFDESCALVDWDPASGQRRTVLAAPRP